MKKTDFIKSAFKSMLVITLFLLTSAYISPVSMAAQNDSCLMTVGERYRPQLGSADVITEYDPEYLQLNKDTFTALKSGKTDITITNNEAQTAEQIRKISVEIYEPIREIYLSTQSLALGIGEKFSLEYSFNSGTLAQTPVFASSNFTIISVSKTGEISAKKAGTAKVFVMLNGITKACDVEVKEEPQSVSLPKSEYNMYLNKGLKLLPSVNENSACMTYEYTSSDESVVTVSQDGTVKSGDKTGTAEITVKTYNGKSTACKVTVHKEPSEITIKENSITLGKGESYKISPILKKDEYESNYTYEASKEGIVSISKSGKIKALKTGKVKITVKTHNELTAELNVRVKKAPQRLKVKKSYYEVTMGKKIKPEFVFDSSEYSRKIKLKSSNKSVAKITSDGKIKAQSMGRAVITATTFNGKQVKLTVDVRALRVPFVSQFPDYPTGCEAAACAQLLKYYKYNISLSQMVRYIPRENVVYKNGRRYGPSITEKFVGDPRHKYGDSSPGYGAFSPCVTKSLQKAIDARGGKHKAVCITGCTFKEMLGKVSGGKPVIAWATYQMMNPTGVNSWYARQPDGTYKYFEYPRGTHVFVIIGYSKSRVTIMDPCGGTRSYDISVFEKRWNLLGKQAIILKKIK